jgi:hypothetical protein
MQKGTPVTDFESLFERKGLVATLILYLGLASINNRILGFILFHTP